MTLEKILADLEQIKNVLNQEKNSLITADQITPYLQNLKGLLEQINSTDQHTTPVKKLKNFVALCTTEALLNRDALLDCIADITQATRIIFKQKLVQSYANHFASATKKVVVHFLLDIDDTLSVNTAPYMHEVVLDALVEFKKLSANACQFYGFSNRSKNDMLINARKVSSYVPVENMTTKFVIEKMHAKQLPMTVIVTRGDLCQPDIGNYYEQHLKAFEEELVGHFNATKNLYHPNTDRSERKGIVDIVNKSLKSINQQIAEEIEKFKECNFEGKINLFNKVSAHIKYAEQNTQHVFVVLDDQDSNVNALNAHAQTNQLDLRAIKVQLGVTQKDTLCADIATAVTELIASMGRKPQQLQQPVVVHPTYSI